MTLTYLVQHAQKQPGAGDPELSALGHDQAARTARWLSRAGLTAVYSSPLRLAVLAIAGTGHLFTGPAG